MSESSSIPEVDLAAALRDRFEADRILGARAVPVRIPQSAFDSAFVAPPRAELQAVRGGGESSVVAEQPAGRRVETGRHFNAAHGLQAGVGEVELAERRFRLEVIDSKEVKSCTRCGLHAHRTQTVFGVGSPAARIMFIGEGPGADEDASGIPFVGLAGQLLTKMIEFGMGLRREDVYIANVVKCRPPKNRTPMPDEIVMCKDYLLRQIEIINPEVIIALGAPAAQTLLNTREGITRLRGQWREFYVSGTSLIGDPIPLMPTFHPAYLLRSPGEKAKAWLDLKAVMARLEMAVPS